VPMTESERHELYELARSQISDRFAELMMNALPPEPERLSTKDDLAVLGSDLRTEMADLRTELKTEMADLRTELKTEMADLRTELKTEMADLRVEMRDLTNQQTRTLTLGLVGSITLLAITQMVLGVIG
jgi:ribosomal protein L29